MYENTVICELTGIALESVTTETQDSFIGAKYLGTSWAKKELSRIVGLQCCFLESKIADGADEKETGDVWIMRDSFLFENSNYVISIFYGDVSGRICYVDVAEC